MNIKKLALAFFAAVTTGSVVTIAAVSNKSILTLADACDHEGYHYEELKATSTTSGTHEYWICCKCNEIWLEQPEPTSSYTWHQGGTTLPVEETDKRYIAPTGEEESDDPVLPDSSDKTAMVNYLTELGFKKVSQNTDGTYACQGFAYNGKDTTIIIPDGVKTIQCYFTSDILNIVVPVGCGLSNTAVKNCSSSAKLFFVGTTTRDDWTISYYQVKDTGWHYENGEPTPGAKA